MNQLNETIKAAKELQTILQENPEIVRFAEILSTHEGNIIFPKVFDSFLTVGEAAKVLGVSKSLIYRYQEEGLLTAYTLPGSSYMKFRASDVLHLAKPKERFA